MKGNEIIAVLNRCSSQATMDVLNKMDRMSEDLPKICGEGTKGLAEELKDMAAALRQINASMRETMRRIENEGVKT